MRGGSGWRGGASGGGGPLASRAVRGEFDPSCGTLPTISVVGFGYATIQVRTGQGQFTCVLAIGYRVALHAHSEALLVVQEPIQQRLPVFWSLLVFGRTRTFQLLFVQGTLRVMVRSRVCSRIFCV